MFTLASFHKMKFTIRNTGEASCVFLSVPRCVIGNFYASLDNLDGTSIRRRFHVQPLRYHTFSFLPTCNTCNISSTQQGSTCIVLFDQMSNHFNHDGHHFLEFSVIDHSTPIRFDSKSISSTRACRKKSNLLDLHRGLMFFLF